MLDKDSIINNYAKDIPDIFDRYIRRESSKSGMLHTPNSIRKAGSRRMRSRIKILNHESKNKNP